MRKNKMLSAIAVATLMLTGCLKDKEYDNRSAQAVRPDGVQQLVEIGLTATSTSNFLTLVFDNSNVDTTFNLVPVNLASAAPAGEDIRVTLVQDNTILDAYNAENGTNFLPPPATAYTVENQGGVVVIPKGSNTGYLRITLKPSALLGAEYAFAYRISSVANTGVTVSSNLRTGIVSIPIRNDYEGEYYSEGFFSHPTAPRAFEGEKYLSTINSTTVAMELGDLGAGTTVLLTINPDNSVTIAPGSGANPATAGINDDAYYNNTYDPATRTFYLKYGYPVGRVITEEVRWQ